MITRSSALKRSGGEQVYIEEAITTYLLACTNLTALIGTRFFYDELPQGTALPAVVCLNVSDVKDHIYGAQQVLENPMFQFTAYATTKLAAKNVAKQIKAAMLAFPGTRSGITVQYVRLENELSTLDTSADGTIKIYTTDLEYELNYERND